MKKTGAWIEKEENIRLALLAGSRAGKKGRVDEFSDYDITLFVKDISTLLSREEEWKARFGTILVQLNERSELGNEEYPTRLILYEDGAKIDFAIFDMEALQGIIERSQIPGWIQAGYEIIADKDGMGKTLETLSQNAPEKKPPTEEEYQAVINEFFWELTYIAKNLKRQELWLAKYSEWVLREETLLKMLEWYAQSKHNWQYDTQYRGKRIKHWLDREKYAQLEKTYSGSGTAENWRALDALITLFEEAAREVGQHLGYQYPEQLAGKVVKYINIPSSS